MANGTQAQKVAEAGGNAGEKAGVSFDNAWKDVRADTDIQFAPAPPPEPAEPPPEWWTDFLDGLGDFFSPVAEGAVSGWPIIRIILIVLLVAGVLTLLWVILSPYLDDWRGRKPKVEEEWIPEEGAARRLLDEADALAASGQYDEAAHLLLFRSIEDIEKRRPDLLRPSNTSREIERFDSLPETARAMFAVIAGYVERGIFADTPIGADGWAASRDAYGAFALKETWRKAKTERAV